MQPPIGYHHLSRNRSGELFQFGTHSSLFCFLFTRRSAMSNSTTSSTVKELSQKTFFSPDDSSESSVTDWRAQPNLREICLWIWILLVMSHTSPAPWMRTKDFDRFPSIASVLSCPSLSFPFSLSPLSRLYTTTTTLCLSLCLSSTWLPVLLI